MGGKSGPASSIPVKYGGKLFEVIESVKESRKKINLDGFVFSTAKGNMWGSDYLGKRFKKALAEHPVFSGTTPYIIKHSAVTYMQECPGITPAMVQAQAGHTRITSQEAYTHRDRTQLDVSVGVFGEYIVSR